jgi:hypothetical protein
MDDDEVAEFYEHAYPNAEAAILPVAITTQVWEFPCKGPDCSVAIGASPGYVRCPSCGQLHDVRYGSLHSPEP